MSKREEFLNSCLVLDVETTSEDFNNTEVIESGFVIKEGESWTVFQDLHKPTKTEIPPQIQALCYITNGMVKDKKPFNKSVELFQKVVDNYTYYVSHSYIFDKTVLESYGIKTEQKNWICTWRMATKLFNGNSKVTETNLGYLRFALDLDVPIEMLSHRAGNDSFVTAKLLEKMLDILEDKGIIDPEDDYGPQVLEWVSGPIIHERMPFGKYKNVKIDELPEDYVKWMIEKMDALNEDSDRYDPDLVATITESIERRNLFA